MPLARPSRGGLGSEAAEFFNRFFVLYTPVIFADGEPLTPDQLVQSGLQAFRNVYAYPTRDFALEVASRLAEAVGADEHVEAWPVEVDAKTRIALDERALGWLGWLDGYDFPVDQHRQWTMLRDGFVWPSVTQGIYGTGATSGSVTAAGTSDFAFKLYEAYESMDPLEVRQRLDEISRAYAPQVLRGAMRTLPIVLHGYEEGSVPPETLHPSLYDLLAGMPPEEAVAKLVPPLRLIDGFKVYAEDAPSAPWLREPPDLADYLAAATGQASREQRRRLLRSRLVTDLPALPGEMAPEETRKLLRRGSRRRLPNRGDVGTPRQYATLRRALERGTPRVIRSPENELLNPEPEYSDLAEDEQYPISPVEIIDALSRMTAEEAERCVSRAVFYVLPRLYWGALEDSPSAPSPTDVAQFIADFTDAWHNHQDAKGLAQLELRNRVLGPGLLGPWPALSRRARHFADLYGREYNVPDPVRAQRHAAYYAADAAYHFSNAVMTELDAPSLRNIGGMSIQDTMLMQAVRAAASSVAFQDPGEEPDEDVTERVDDFLASWWNRCLAALGPLRPGRPEALTWVVGTPPAYKQLREHLERGTPRHIESVEYELLNPTPVFSDVPAYWQAPTRGLGLTPLLPQFLERLHLDELTRCVGYAVDQTAPALEYARGRGIVAREPLLPIWRRAWQEQRSNEDWWLIRALAQGYAERIRQQLYDTPRTPDTEKDVVELAMAYHAARAIQSYGFAQSDPPNARGHLLGALTLAFEVAGRADDDGAMTAAGEERRRQFIESWGARCLASKGVQRPMRRMNEWIIGDYEPGREFYADWHYEVVTPDADIEEAVLAAIYEAWERLSLYEIFGSLRWDFVDLEGAGEMVRYIDGTGATPVVVIDPAVFTEALDAGLSTDQALLPSLYYALGAAAMDMSGLGEVDAEIADEVLTEFADDLFAVDISWDQAVDDLRRRLQDRGVEID